MQRDALLIAEAIDAAERAVDIVADLGLADFERDRLRVDALLWNLTVLGEAVAQLSPSTIEANPNIEWRRPVDLRNRIVHGYWSIDLAVLHNVVIDDLPPFIVRLAGAQANLDRPDQS